MVSSKACTSRPRKELVGRELPLWIKGRVEFHLLYKELRVILILLSPSACSLVQRIILHLLMCIWTHPPRIVEETAETNVTEISFAPWKTVQCSNGNDFEQALCFCHTALCTYFVRLDCVLEAEVVSLCTHVNIEIWCVQCRSHERGSPEVSGKNARFSRQFGLAYVPATAENTIDQLTVSTALSLLAQHIGLCIHHQQKGESSPTPRN